MVVRLLIIKVAFILHFGFVGLMNLNFVFMVLQKCKVIKPKLANCRDKTVIFR